MNSSRFLVILVGILVLLVIGWSSIFIVYPAQQVALLRFRAVVTVKNKPGIYFKLPFIDQQVVIDNRQRRFDLPTRRVQVKDGRFYMVDAFLIYHISDASRFLSTVGSGDPSIAEGRLRPEFESMLDIVYNSREFDAALSAERPNMMREVQTMITPKAANYGITVVDLRILKTELTSEVSQETFQKMIQERQTEAERLRALGNEERQRIQAGADREAVEIVAQATRDSEIIRGEGEAERARLFAEATDKDPQFYTFWRSMDAYSKLHDTPMILSPDSSFFRYFGQSSGNKPSAR